MSTLFVEFVGLPGSGKSTIYRHLLGRLSTDGRGEAAPGASRGEAARGAGASRREVRRFQGLHFLRFHLRNLPLLRDLFLLAVQIRPLRWSRVRFLRKVIFSCYYFGRPERQVQDVVLFDQFAIQALWSAAMFGSPARPSTLDRVVSRIAAHGRRILLVHVETAPDIAVRRMGARRATGERSGAHRFDLLPPRVADEVLAEGSILLRELTVLAGVHGMSVCRVEGSRPPDENAAHLAAVIRDQLRIMHAPAPRA